MLLEDSHHAAELLSNSLRDNCLGNSELLHYNESNLITITRLLEHNGCVWEQDSNNNSLAMAVVDNTHHRRRRSAGPAAEGTNPTIGVFSEVIHILHLSSVVILAIMAFEVWYSSSYNCLFSVFTILHIFLPLHGCIVFWCVVNS